MENIETIRVNDEKYSTDFKTAGWVAYTVDVILEEEKEIGFYGSPHTLMVYRGYKEGKLVFEIEAGSGVILTFK